MKPILAGVLTSIAGLASATWTVQDSGSKVQFRGVSAVSALVCWAAGADGTFARTTDGQSWTSRQIPGAEKMVFRSIVAWDANHATILAIGKGDASRIYHTDDGGANWTLQFINPDPAAFYDAIQFWDQRHGIAMSDPVNGKFRLLRTDDGGKAWRVVSDEGMPNALQGEGAFAASGTCLVVKGTQDAWFATGGASFTRVFHSADRGGHWTVSQTPISAKKETAGVFGLAFLNAKEGVAVGGDYKDVESENGTVAVTVDGGQTWNSVLNSALFRSNPAREGLFEGAGFPDAHTLVVVGPKRAKHAAGLNSLGAGLGDLAVEWRTDESDTIAGLHACSFVSGITDPLAQAGWAVGDNGLIAKWIWSP